MGPDGAPYCTVANLAQYMPAAVLNLATTAQQQQACLDASETMDSYFRGRFNLPLLTWGADVTRYTAYVACYLLCTLIGFAPQADSDRLIVQRYYESVGFPDRPGSGWGPGVQRQAIQPDVTPSIPIGLNSGVDLPQVTSNPPRGWPMFRNGKPVIGGF